MISSSNPLSCCWNSGTCTLSKVSSACCGRASTSKGLSLPFRTKRARSATVGTARSSSREIDIVFHLAVEIEGVLGFRERRQRLCVRGQADAALRVERPQRVVELTDAERRSALLEQLVDPR